MIKHAKKQENMTHNEKKKHSLETNLELIQILEIADKVL